MVWFEKSDLLQVFYFFSSCKLPGKKENRQKKNLKGIVYLFDSLRILFSYNLSAIKCGFFFFHFKHISCLFLLPVWRHHMFNKANYLVNYIHEGILLTFITGVVGQIYHRKPVVWQTFMLFIRLEFPYWTGGPFNGSLGEELFYFIDDTLFILPPNEVLFFSAVGKLKFIQIAVLMRHITSLRSKIVPLILKRLAN